MRLFKDDNTLGGVGCGAVHCKYHGEGNCCHADSINVESRSATKKGETFCSTFCAKDE